MPIFFTTIVIVTGWFTTGLSGATVRPVTVRSGWITWKMVGPPMLLVSSLSVMAQS